MREPSWHWPWQRGVEVTPPLNEGIVEGLLPPLNQTHDHSI
jgi:hypothetical protein